jgi:hypothetical protein
MSTKRRDTNKGRYYEVGGIDYPSVTTVLQVINKPALIPWAKNMMADRIKSEFLTYTPGNVSPVEWIDAVIARAKKRPDQMKSQAADFGTRAHQVVEDIIKGKNPSVAPEFEPVVQAFMEWYRTTRLSILESEIAVHSVVHRFAGTMDILAQVEGELTVLDLKTSNGIYDEYDMQVAAYAKAYEEMVGKPVKSAWILRLGKTKPEFETKYIEDVEPAFKGFLGALALWRYLRKKS